MLQQRELYEDIAAGDLFAIKLDCKPLKVLMKTPLKDNFYDFYGVLSVVRDTILYGVPSPFEKSSFFFRYSDIFKVNLSANILDNEYRSSILKEIKECAFFLLQTLQLRGSEVSAKPSAHCSQCVSLPLMFYNANERRTQWLT